MAQPNQFTGTITITRGLVTCKDGEIQYRVFDAVTSCSPRCELSDICDGQRKGKCAILRNHVYAYTTFYAKYIPQMTELQVNRLGSILMPLQVELAELQIDLYKLKREDERDYERMAKMRREIKDTVTRIMKMEKSLGIDKEVDMLFTPSGSDDDAGDPGWGNPNR